MKWLLIPIFLVLAPIAACGNDAPAPTDITGADTSADGHGEDVALPDTTAADDTADTVTPPNDTADETSLPGDTLEPVDVVDAVDEVDAGPDGVTGDTTVEPTLPLPGFGAITGPCGFIDDELYDDAPSFVVNALDFGDDPYDSSDFDRLTVAGQEMIRDGNAGGNSLYSEVFSAEVLVRCELATLLATETEIIYDTQGKITDFLAEIDGERVGVSVVRAVGFPKDAPYTVEQATTILERKLNDILESSANVSAQHVWVKQILHVLAYADQHAESMRAAWEGLSTATRADTIVIVTVTHGSDLFMY